MPKKNASGKYRGRVQIGIGPDGKPMNKYVSAPTMRELEEKKREVRQHYIEGVPLQDDMPFHVYAEQWYTLKKEPLIADSSKVYYRSCFTKHLLPAFGMRHLRAIRAHEIQAFINAYSGVAKSTITMLIGILKGIFSSAAGEGIIQINPTLGLVRPKAKKVEERRALTEWESQRVLQTIDKHEHGAILAVLFYLGVRRGECLGLKWGDFDWNEDFVHIQRDIDYMTRTAREGELKTETADRYVPIPPQLRAILHPKRQLPDTYVFCTDQQKPIPQATFQRIWLSLMMDCGCTVEREVKEGTKRPTDLRKRYKATLTPHYFRHNYITILYESEVDPLISMKIVGHKDYQTTANIYTHLKEETLKKATYDMQKVFAAKQAAPKIRKLGI